MVAQSNCCIWMGQDRIGIIPAIRLDESDDLFKKEKKMDNLIKEGSVLLGEKKSH